MTMELRIKNYIYAFTCLFVLSSCSEDYDWNDVIVSKSELVKPSLEVNGTSLTYEGRGGVQSIEIVSTTTWTATGLDWCDLSTYSGVGHSQISVTASPNATGQQRTGQIVVRADGCADCFILVSQDAMVPGNDDNVPPGLLRTAWY